MCDTCGCSNPDEFRINDPDHHDDHEHPHHSHDHTHPHDHNHDHHHGGPGLFHSHSSAKVINLNLDILSDNNRLAERNRGFFMAKEIRCLNMVSSPGSGKTSILERTIIEQESGRRIFVIEGDQQTSRDAERIEKSGATALQINTGSGCHLDAKMVHLALDKLKVGNQSLLFIENVGNLVCPAMFDLGELKRVVVISVTEGDDKPLKYPFMFQTSNLCLINKSDLLPYVDFSVDRVIEHASTLNPSLDFIVMSVKTGEGMNKWYDWLKAL